MKNKLKTSLSKLFKSKLFIASMAIYLAIASTIALVVFSDVSFRTAGVYQYFVDEELVEEVILYKNNAAKFLNYDKEGKNKDDIENRLSDKVTKWNYHYYDEIEQYRKRGCEYVSMELVLFSGNEKGTYFSLFKIDNCLYTDYVLSPERGGGQKCFVKK